MKKNIFKYAVVLTTTFLLIASCTKTETDSTETNDVERVMTPTDSLLKRDSTNLSYDSATVKTAVGVQAEERNAIKQQKLHEEKLQKDLQ